MTPDNVWSSACRVSETDLLCFTGYFLRVLTWTQNIKMLYHYFILPLAVSASCLYHQVVNLYPQFLGIIWGVSINFSLFSFLHRKILTNFLLSPYLNFWNFIVFRDMCFVVQLILCAVFFTPTRKTYHIKAVRHNEMQLVWIPNNDSEPEETEEFSTVIRLFYS